MSIGSIMNIISAQQEQETPLKAEADYQSGLFGLTPQELKQAKRDETMDLLRYGQAAGLTTGQIGVGMLLGQAARALTGKDDARDLDLQQREVNREAFLEQLKGASNQELIDLGTKLMVSEDDESRSFGYQLFGQGRSGLAAELAAAKSAGEYNPKNATEQDVNLGIGVLKSMGYKGADLGVGSAIASEFRRLQELNRDDPEWSGKPVIEHYRSIVQDFEDKGYLQVGRGGFPYLSKEAEIGLGNQAEEEANEEAIRVRKQRDNYLNQYK